MIIHCIRIDGKITTSQGFTENASHSSSPPVQALGPQAFKPWEKGGTIPPNESTERAHVEMNERSNGALKLMNK